MIELFGLTFRMYGLLIGVGILVSASLAARLVQKQGWAEELIWDGLWWVIIPGLVGARLYHVIDLWWFYQDNLGEIIKIWHGGLGIFGGLIGGLVGLFIFLSTQGKKFVNSKQDPVQTLLFPLLDIAAMCLPLGQAIGRWGNFFNQELYGYPTDLPWGIFISPENRLPGFENSTHFHPLFAYESCFNFLLFCLLFFFSKRTEKRFGSGFYLGVYMMGYGIIRFLLEPMRIEKWSLSGLPTAQLFSGMMIVVGLVLVYRTNNKK